MSKTILQQGKLTVENRKSRERKTDMLRSIGKQSGNPWSQSRSYIFNVLRNLLHILVSDLPQRQSFVRKWENRIAG